MPIEWAGAALVERMAASLVEPGARVIDRWDALAYPGAGRSV